MLTFPEKIIFVLLALAAVYAGWRVADRVIRILGRGQGKVDWRPVPGRAAGVLAKVLTLQPVWRIRFWASLFHAFVAWGFIYYLLVNLGDVLEGFFPDFRFLGRGLLGGVYRLGADLLSVAALVGMVALILRRQVEKPADLTTRETTLLHPKAQKGIQRDSLIVGLFILLHVGSRFLGVSFEVAAHGGDPWQPFASLVCGSLAGAQPAGP